METCWKCGAGLSADEVGLNYKILNRGVKTYQCIHCLAETFRTSVPKLRELIENFRAAGCSMFPPCAKGE
jgi:hypothetical protein